LYHTICIALENDQITVAVFCDISKAFDRLWHKGFDQNYPCGTPVFNDPSQEIELFNKTCFLSEI
jgi:hypothetical protein